MNHAVMFQVDLEQRSAPTLWVYKPRKKRVNVCLFLDFGGCVWSRGAQPVSSLNITASHHQSGNPAAGRLHFDSFTVQPPNLLNYYTDQKCGGYVKLRPLRLHSGLFIRLLISLAVLCLSLEMKCSPRWWGRFHFFIAVQFKLL